jgi:hypothetical protein
MKLLAKSNGLELKVHSQIVSKTSLLLNNISSKEIADRYSKTIVIQPCYTILVN